MTKSQLIVIGHRGACGLAPENTLASIKAALDNAVDMVEIDVYVARDGAVLLNHDEYYLDTAGKKIRIYDTTYVDMKAHDTDVATLQEAIELINKKVPLIIELKPGVNADMVCHLVANYYQRGWTEHDLRFCSYDPKLLKRIRQHFPKAIIIVNEDWSSLRAVRRAKKLGTPYVAIYYRWLWSGVIKNLTRQGFILSSFTINRPQLAKHWSKNGLTAIYTDYPDRFKK